MLLGVDIKYEISGLLGLLAYLMSNYSIIPQNEREPNILLKYMGLASQIMLLFSLFFVPLPNSCTTFSLSSIQTVKIRNQKTHYILFNFVST